MDNQELAIGLIIFHIVSWFIAIGYEEGEELKQVPRWVANLSFPFFIGASVWLLSLHVIQVSKVKSNLAAIVLFTFSASYIPKLFQNFGGSNFGFVVDRLFGSNNERGYRKIGKITSGPKMRLWHEKVEEKDSLQMIIVQGEVDAETADGATLPATTVVGTLIADISKNAQAYYEIQGDRRKYLEEMGKAALISLFGDKLKDKTENEIMSRKAHIADELLSEIPEDHPKINGFKFLSLTIKDPSRSDQLRKSKEGAIISEDQRNEALTNLAAIGIRKDDYTTKEEKRQFHDMLQEEIRRIQVNSDEATLELKKIDVTRNNASTGDDNIMATV